MVLHIRDELVGSAMLGHDFKGKLPPLEEVVKDNVIYDMEDALKVSLVTPRPEDVLQRILNCAEVCNLVSELLVCKSMHSYKRGRWVARLQGNCH